MRDHPTRRVERLLTLRQFPGLADAELAELAVIAENVVERFYPAGARVAGPARPAAIQMVVAGRLAAVDGSRTWVPHHAVGAVEVIAGRASVAPMTAEVDTRTLEIAADDFRELLADNFTVMSTAWRLLAARLLAAGREGVCDELSRRAARRLLVDATSEPLDLVTRIELLRRCLPFPGGYIQAMAALAVASHEERVPAGAHVQRAGATADTVTMIIEGTGRVVGPSPRGERQVLPGQSVGRLETLAQAPYVATVEAATPMRLLRVPLPALLDIMEDHTDFAMALVTQLAAGVLALEAGVSHAGVN